MGRWSRCMNRRCVWHCPRFRVGAHCRSAQAVVRRRKALAPELPPREYGGFTPSLIRDAVAGVRGEVLSLYAAESEVRRATSPAVGPPADAPQRLPAIFASGEATALLHRLDAALGEAAGGAWNEALNALVLATKAVEAELMVGFAVGAGGGHADRVVERREDVERPGRRRDRQARASRCCKCRRWRG